MPNTGMLIIGALGLLFLVRGQKNGTEGLSELVSSDLRSSGGSGFGGNVDNLNPPSITRLLSGDIPFTTLGVTSTKAETPAAKVNSVEAVIAMAVDAISGIPKSADNLAPPEKEITGTLSALFKAQGVTISEISGNAVRQVGILSPYESVLNTANSPSVALVNITTEGGGPPVLLEEDTPIEVLPPAPGAPTVVTIAGNDESTVVTTGINRWTTSYFTEPGTIVEAVNQGYFNAPTAYVPRTWQQIEADWAAAQEIPEQQEVLAPVMLPAPNIDWLRTFAGDE
jgi:hypothetical protein